jgi:hypothetical protein
LSFHHKYIPYAFAIPDGRKPCIQNLHSFA